MEEPKRAIPESATGGTPPPEIPARKRRPTYDDAQRAEILRAFHRSKQSLAEFCRRRGISTSTLRRWLNAEGRSASRRGRGAGHERKRRCHFSPEEKRAAVEAFQETSLSQTRFCATWGVSVGSLRSWLKLYDEGGPQALEPRPKKKATRPDDQRPLSSTLKEEILKMRARYPQAGARRVRDHLFRFRGLKVSATSVQKVLKEAGVSPQPLKKRRRRSADRIRRFERARPGELWQSDITSFVLRRQHRRVYLTVFLDDHSRYIVSWSLRTSQRQELVTECLLEGVARFGKPREVLTDQGRQYFAWRGKSGFQKLLDREGIRHVVSRAHHPQTLGKCERLWKTVGQEFWDRAKPEDLSDARRRLGHFFSHYNHFRPHQGIGGLVPADRFFSAEESLRRTLEEELPRDALQRALAEPSRKSVFLFGRVGDEEVSLHGERGELVMHTEKGLQQAMKLDELGLGRKEDTDERAEEGSGDEGARDALGSSGVAADAESGGAGKRGGRCGSELIEAEADTPQPQENPLCDSRTSGAEREGPVGAGGREGSAAGAPSRDGDPGDLARKEDALGGRGGAGPAGAADLAALAAGGVGYAGGPFDPAAYPAESEESSAAARGGSRAASSRECPPAKGTGDRASSDGGLEDAAGSPDASREEERAGPKDQGARKKKKRRFDILRLFGKGSDASSRKGG